MELALEPATSVARVAKAESVNANHAFKWRGGYRNGRLVEAAESKTALLPVVVPTASSEACIEPSRPLCLEPAAPSSV
jgi:transposase-like protein